MNQSATKKVLIVSPHPDDGIIGCGGTIARFLEEGKDIKYLVISWQGQGFNEEEIKDAICELGIKEDNLIILDYEVRKFSEVSGKIRDELINIREQYKPDLVLVHNSNDIHQDHEVCSREAFRVFREGTVLGYMLPWNLRKLEVDMLYSLEEKHVEKKITAMNKLETQKFRFYYDPATMRSLVKTMGLFRRKKYAEAFEILSMVK